MPPLTKKAMTNVQPSSHAPTVLLFALRRSSKLRQSPPDLARPFGKGRRSVASGSWRRNRIPTFAPRLLNVRILGRTQGPEVAPVRPCRVIAAVRGLVAQVEVHALRVIVGQLRRKIEPEPDPADHRARHRYRLWVARHVLG